jgi:hypothetical protein
MEDGAEVKPKSSAPEHVTGKPGRSTVERPCRNFEATTYAKHADGSGCASYRGTVKILPVPTIFPPAFNPADELGVSFAGNDR